MRPVPAHPARTALRAQPLPGDGPPARQPLVIDLSLRGARARSPAAHRGDGLRLLLGRGRRRAPAGGQHGSVGPLAAPSPGAGRDQPRSTTATTLLGSPVSSPVAIAADSHQGLAHPEGEVATAHGAAEVGALMILSSLATCPLEEVAAAAPDAARWMQVYIFRERARTVELVRAGRGTRLRGAVLTVDAPVSGLRLREWRVGVHLPEDLALPNLAGGSTDSARGGGFMAVVTHEFEPALTPDDIGWLAGLSRLPVVVKGVQRADDAVRCVEAGAAAVVVSNHGARQLADAPPTADILGRGGRRRGGAGRGLRRRRHTPGARRGEGAGARAPGPRWSAGRRCGRWPPVGADGVTWLLRWYEAEVRRAMALCGVATVDAPGATGAPDTGMGAGHDERRHNGGCPGRRRTHRCDGWRRKLDVAPGRGGGCERGALARSRSGAGQAPHGLLLPNGAEYLFWAERRRAGRSRQGGHQPHAAGRGARCRHARHRLRHDRDRRRRSCAVPRAWPSA